MKKTVLVLSAFLLGFVISAQEAKKEEPVNTVHFINESINTICDLITMQYAYRSI